jgi:hypothetical protein
MLALMIHCLAQTLVFQSPTGAKITENEIWDMVPLGQQSMRGVYDNGQNQPTAHC